MPHGQGGEEAQPEVAAQSAAADEQSLATALRKASLHSPPPDLTRMLALSALEETDLEQAQRMRHAGSTPAPYTAPRPPSLTSEAAGSAPGPLDDGIAGPAYHGASIGALHGASAQRSAAPGVANAGLIGASTGHGAFEHHDTPHPNELLLFQHAAGGNVNLAGLHAPTRISPAPAAARIG